MSLDVRAITPDELPAWVNTNFVAFHNDGSVADAVAYHTERLAGQVDRCLATFDGPHLVGTYESFATELTLPGGACLPTNAVTAVAVLPTHHRRGALTRMLTQDMRAARERGEAGSILLASEYPIYGRFGFGPATTAAAYRLEIASARFTDAASGRIELIEPEALRQIAPDVFETIRHSVPGQISRRPFTWDTRLGLRARPWRGGEQRPRCALYTHPTGEPEGYLVYRVDRQWANRLPSTTLQVDELATLTPAAYLGLWRYMAEVDLISDITIAGRPTDEPLAWLLTNPRRALQQTARSDFLWLRALDTPRLLAGRRYAAEDRLVLDVEDPLDLAGGRFALEVGPSGADCRPSTATPDLRLGMHALGAISLGGVSLHTLHAAGRIVEERSGSLARAERMFHSEIAPWCSTFF